MKVSILHMRQLRQFYSTSVGQHFEAWTWTSGSKRDTWHTNIQYNGAACAILRDGTVMCREMNVLTSLAMEQQR